MKNYFIIILMAFAVSGCAATITPVPPLPPPQTEVVTVAPYPGAVWAGGVWVWHPGHRRYLWRHGYWHR